MIRVEEVQNSLLPLIGWEQNHDTSEIKLSESLTKSESGLYYQQAHPLLTLKNLDSIAPDFKNYAYLDYDSAKTFQKGNVVKVGETLYKALQKVAGISPEDDTLGHWEETNPFSEWLESKTRASIQKAITRFLSEKMLNGNYKPLCESKVLFDLAGRISDRVQNRKRLVGFEIVPARTKGVTVKLNRIGLQFTKKGDYTLYLMHSDSSEPIQTITVTKQKDNSMEWFMPKDDIILPYMGGSWYLCYVQSELPEESQAIKKDYDWSKGPCSSCSRTETILWKAWSPYLEIHPFYVSSDDYVKEETLQLWDVEKNTYVYDNNFGLNLDVTVSCDLTDFIIEQRTLFLDALQLQMAADMLREFAYNPNVRTNRHSINASRVDILYELDGDSASFKKSGINYRLDNALKAIRLVVRGIDRICQPCSNNGIKYRAV
jgi:hypothetical protein